MHIIRSRVVIEAFSNNAIADIAEKPLESPATVILYDHDSKRYNINI